MPRYQCDADRITLNVRVDADGCWNWTGALTEKGYGRLRAAGKSHRTHRFAYEVFIGPIPEGLQLDHLCRNRACCNPEHLEPTTARENLLRSPLTIQSINAAKTHCKNGHPFEDWNTYQRSGGGRKCRTCALASARATRERAA